MYIIKRFGKRFSKHTFFTYEEARSYLRKYIRKFYSKDRIYNNFQYGTDYGDLFYNNPSTSNYGFKIQYSDKAGPRCPF